MRATEILGSCYSNKYKPNFFELWVEGPSLNIVPYNSGGVF
jgi:hypothetical protein